VATALLARFVGTARWRGFAALAALFAVEATSAQPLAVTVRKLGDQVIVDVSARVEARADCVWEVLTDYDHMAEYLSAIKSSQVVSRRGNELEVAQSGEARRGFLHFSFSTVRAVELRGEREIRSHLIRGDFKSYEFTTRIVPEAGGMVSILHHGEYVPTTWVPPVVGPAMIETETRKQYGELIAEILRRQACGAHNPAAR
jgi:ribosome-associated toxin RatA of RatAB toxin-antitoxin module